MKEHKEFTDYFYSLKADEITVSQLLKAMFLLTEYYDTRLNAIQLNCSDSKGHYAHTCIDVANKMLDKDWLLKVIEFKHEMKKHG